jgi:hypothetical protein
MARRSTRTPPDPASLAGERKEIRALARLLRRPPQTLADYYAIGERMHALGEDEARTGYGSGWRKTIADLLGRSESTLTKCLHFFKDCTRGELAALEELGAGWAQLGVAFSVKDKKERLELLKRAKREDWGQKELRREVCRLKGKPRGGGRPRKEERSRGCLADAVELARRAGLYGDSYRQAWSGNEAKYLAEVANLTGDARVGMERALADAEEKLKTLRGQCADALKDVKALLKKLPPGE